MQQWADVLIKVEKHTTSFLFEILGWNSGFEDVMRRHKFRKERSLQSSRALSSPKHVLKIQFPISEVPRLHFMDEVG
jgi:hypothetical protein